MRKGLLTLAGAFVAVVGLSLAVPEQTVMAGHGCGGRHHRRGCCGCYGYYGGGYYGCCGPVTNNCGYGGCAPGYGGGAGYGGGGYGPTGGAGMAPTPAPAGNGAPPPAAPAPGA